MAGDNRVLVIAAELKVGLQAVGIVQMVSHKEEVGQGPGFGIKDASLLLFVVVGRFVVDAKEHVERDDRVVAKVFDVVDIGHADFHVLGADLGVLEELG